MITDKDYCIILAGGAGRRLWPYSRMERPKQFLDFLGTGRSLLQQTFERMASIFPQTNIYVSTYVDYVPLVQEHLPDLSHENILAEPVQLSTAPATARAALHIALQEPAANILVTPCDQYIVGEAQFAQEIEEGLRFVNEKKVFLAMGVRATLPNPAYGYIQTGQEVEPHLYTVKFFTEKPDVELAKTLVDTNEFLWNTGLFLWSAHNVTQLVSDVVPEIAAIMETEWQNLDTNRLDELVRCYYPASLRRSIDLVILEKVRSNTYVRECSFTWADIGCWPELYAVAPKDADGNAVVGNSSVLFSGSRETLVCIPDEVSAVVRGLDGYLLASDGRTIVVCPNEDPALVRTLLNEARAAFNDDSA